MNEDKLRKAAESFAWASFPQDHNSLLRSMLVEVFEAGAKWQAEQEDQ